MKSIKFNYFMNTLLTLLNILFPILVFPYLSRILLPEGMGRIVFVMGMISYLTLIAQTGIPIYGIRACAQVRDDKILLSKTVHELLIISGIMTIIVYILLGIMLLFSSRIAGEKNLFFIMSGNIVLTTLGIQWLYSALERYTYITLRSFLFKLLSVIMIFLFVNNAEDYIICAMIFVFASAGSNLCNLIYAHKFIIFQPLENYHFKYHIKSISIFFITNLAISFYVYLNIVILGFISGNFAVGLYDLGNKLSGALICIVSSLASVLLPRMSHYIKSNKLKEFRRIVAKSMRFNTLIALPLTLYFIFFAQEIVFLFGGSHYQESILPLQVLMPTIYCSGIWSITGTQMLVPMGKEKQLMYSAIGGAIVNCSLNFLLIPFYGVVGAALSMLITQIIVILIQIIFLKEYWEELFVYMKSKQYLINIISLIIMLIILKKVVFYHVFWNILITFSGYILGYFLLLFYLKEPLLYEVFIILEKKWKHKK